MLKLHILGHHHGHNLCISIEGTKHEDLFSICKILDPWISIWWVTSRSNMHGSCKSNRSGILTTHPSQRMISTISIFLVWLFRQLNFFFYFQKKVLLVTSIRPDIFYFDTLRTLIKILHPRNLLFLNFLPTVWLFSLASPATGLYLSHHPHCHFALDMSSDVVASHPFETKTCSWLKSHNFFYIYLTVLY